MDSAVEKAVKALTEATDFMFENHCHAWLFTKEFPLFYQLYENLNKIGSVKLSDESKCEQFNEVP